MRWTDDPTIWLRQESRDLLDAGPVGLYEMIWLLRGGFPELSDDRKLAIATQVANETLEAEGLVLRRLRWPTMLVLEEIGRGIVEPEDFVLDEGEDFVAAVEGPPLLRLAES